jgi:pyrroloquinoline quinone (PQQ) biosynthesis protein C
MTNSSFCISMVELARESVRKLDSHPIAGQLIVGSLTKPRYIRYLMQAMHQVRGSGPMLATAGTRLLEMDRPLLAALFARKAGEEDAHDRWAMNDLLALGVEETAVEKMASRFAAVEAYVAWTRFLVELSPVAVLGVAWTLEWFGFARAGAAAEAMTKHSKIPNIAKATSFLRGHGDADQAHVEALKNALGEITSSEEAEAIELSARVTAASYLGFFDEAGKVVEAC